MREKRKRLALALLVACMSIIVVLVVAGCEEASDTSEETEATETTEETDTTGTTGDTEEETETTEGSEDDDGQTDTTSGEPESVAEVSEQFKTCTDCHSDFNRFLQESEVLTANFSHAVHLNKGFKCESCHEVPTHKPDSIVRPSMLSCFDCHGQEEDAMAPGECGACHPSDFSLVPSNHSGGWLPSGDPGLVKVVSARHADRAQEDRDYCEMCHTKSFCLDCHQVDMPHGDDWQQVHSEKVNSLGETACATCHPQEYICNDCHHTGYEPGDTPWRDQHPPIVEEAGAEDCFVCHNPIQCARCHITGELDMDLEPTG